MDGKVSQNLSVDFTGGDTYFNADVNRAFENKEYRFTVTAPGGGTIEPSRSFSGKTRFITEAELTEKGTYGLSMSRTGTPMYFCKILDGTWLPKSKDELDISQKNGAACGGYFQHTKSYVSLIETTDIWKTLMGHPLEIIPLSHPNTLLAGDRFSFQVLYQNKPLAGAKVIGISQGYRAKKHGDTPISVTTDADGKASMTFDLAARWLITLTHEFPNNTEKMDTMAHQASLMLEVNEPWVKSWLEDKPQ